MRVFFHHVGGAMAARDFPRTVFSPVSVKRVEENVSKGRRLHQLLVERLRREFPEGKFNVWGVPSGARSVLKLMDEGDFFLLVGLAGLHGSVPAMGQVRVFVRDDFAQLSEALWGEARFPVVFFFETERLEYTWWDFTDDLDYKGHWRPAGMVYRIKPERMERFGGAEGYIKHVRTNYAGD